MSRRTIEIEREGPVARLWLSRPQVHNAFDAALIDELTQGFLAMDEAYDVRVVVLASRGKSFSAGADVSWMREQGAASIAENKADARRLAELFRTVAECSKPTVARVQGAAIGGGLGLVCVCDVAIASTHAVFATTEVRLGLIPATIAPYVVRAIGPRQARRWFQTGERFNAATAERIGLLHDAVEPDLLDRRVEEVVEALLLGAPVAQREAKTLIDDVAHRAADTALIEETAERIASRRADPEAAEGLRAFLDKRPPLWVASR